MIGTTDWTGIATLVGVILAGIPGIIAAVYAARVHTEVKNPNGTTTGKSIESMRQTMGAPEEPTIPAPHPDPPPSQ